MNLSQSSIHAFKPVINNTINNLSSPVVEVTARYLQEERFRDEIAKSAIHSASFDAVERGDPPRCHPDTRVAPRESLAVWPDDPSAGPVRWISGWTGTGKSTMVQTMAEYWARQRRLAGSFFFTVLSEDKSTILWFPDTILHQILQIFDVPIPQHISWHSLTWRRAVEILETVVPRIQSPMVIVIDGLDECRNPIDQKRLLYFLLSYVDRINPSIKLLISSRPELHLEKIFEEFAPQLGPDYRLHLGQSAQDHEDIRRFLRGSLERVCQYHRREGTMSIAEGLWPQEDQIEMLVNRASGQFVYAATVISFVDDESQDPVEALKLVTDGRFGSFEPIDALYLLILERAKKAVASQLHQMMDNLLLHVNYEPSTAAEIGEFWFVNEVKINILVTHLRAVLVRHNGLQSPIQFRHNSFYDFLERPSSPHPFSLTEINPVSKFFFSLRKLLGKSSPSVVNLQSLRGSQSLGYSFLYCDSHQLAVVPYEHAARRLHKKYVNKRPTFRGCPCLPQLLPIAANMRAMRAFQSCQEHDCIITPELLALCGMLEMPINEFIQGWEVQELLRPISFRVLTCGLWLRLALYGMLNPFSELEATICAMIFRSSRWNRLTRGSAVVNLALCLVAWITHMNCFEFFIFLQLSYVVTNQVLGRFLRTSLTPTETPDEASETPSPSSSSSP